VGPGELMIPLRLAPHPGYCATRTLEQSAISRWTTSRCRYAARTAQRGGGSGLRGL